MGRFDKRMKELEKRQEKIQLQLERLDLADKPQEHCEEKDFRNERKIILRELTDVMIRIRNLERNQKKGLALKSVELPPEGEERCSKVQGDLDTEDESFNPEAVEMKHTRPEMMKYPHSLPAWDRVVRVGREGHSRAAGRLTDWQGQFAGVEEEGGRFGLQIREGRQWTWNKMNESSRKDESESWREEKVEGFCKLDSLPHIVKSPEVSSSDQRSSHPSVTTALPDIAHLKTLFPFNKLPAPLISSPDQQNLNMSPSPVQDFTKIKSRVNNNQISRINSIISQNSNMDSKPLPVQVNQICDMNTGRQSMTRQTSESGHEEQKTPRGSTPLLLATQMITVRAKLISSPGASPPLTSVAAAQEEPLREKLRKRLIRSKD